MSVSKLSDALRKSISPIAYVSVGCGALAIAMMMAVITMDVTLRTTISVAISGTIDIIELLLLVTFFSAYAYAELRGKHITVEVLVERLPQRVRQIITTNGYLLTIGITILVSWQIFLRMGAAKAGGTATSLLHIPVWPVIGLVGFFIALFALTLIVSFLNHLASLLTMGIIKAYSWLLPGVILALGLFVVSVWPSLLPFEITRSMWGLIITLLLFVLIFLKVHIGAAMAVTALLGVSYLSGGIPGLANLAITATGAAAKYTWSVIPLFMWMGILAGAAGFARELYMTAYKWVGHLPGGLASATVGACAGLAAITGSALTGVLALAPIVLPEMKRYGYDPKLATATLCTASTIGILIPPSLVFIVYGVMTGVSIGKLFIAGILPGILLSLALIVMISIRCYLNPRLGPPGPATSWKEKVVSIKDIWAVALLVIFVLGGIYAGVFTPTEAGAMGAFGAIVIGVARRRLPFKDLVSSAIRAVEMTGVIFFIFLFAVAFSRFLALTHLPYDLSEWVIGLGLSKYAIISLILFIYVILGCLMNAMPAVMLTLPIFFPIVMAAGFDPIWFGVLIVIMVEIGTITPPIGMTVFAMSAIATDVPMYSIFRGILPYFAVLVIVVVILVAFPQISLFLPSFMK